SLQVPAGFTVNIFADGQNGVRCLALGPGGAVFATLSGDGRIVRLVDSNGDGVADSGTTVLSGLDGPFGLAFRGDTMYFAEETSVKRLDPEAAGPVTLVSNLPGGGHTTRTVVFGPDNLLYVAVGSSCNLGADRARVLHGHAVSGRIRGRCLHDVSRLVEPQRPDGREGRVRAGAERAPRLR